MQITTWIFIWLVSECRYDDLDRARTTDGRGGQQFECAGGRALCSARARQGGRAARGSQLQPAAGGARRVAAAA